MFFGKSAEIIRLRNVNRLLRREIRERIAMDPHEPYDIRETVLHADSEPRVVKVAFSLPFRDWCRLAGSDEWKSLAHLLLKMKKECSR